MISLPTRRELFAWLLALALAVTFVIGWTTSSADGSYADNGEIPTSSAEEAIPNPEAPPAGTPLTVYVATGENFPDALGAAAAAGVAMGPVLLVTSTNIPAPTLAELNRLMPNRIVIVGGTAVISNTVELALQGLSFTPTVDRIAGTNRYDTAAQLSADSNWTRGFFPRSTWSQIGDSSDVAGDNAEQVVATVDHTTAMPGIYVITAGADMYTFGDGDTSVECSIYVDGVQLEPSRRSVELNGGDASETDCATQAVFLATTAKTYTIALVINADTDIMIDERSVIATWQAYYPGS